MVIRTSCIRHTPCLRYCAGSGSEIIDPLAVARTCHYWGDTIATHATNPIAIARLSPPVPPVAGFKRKSVDEQGARC